MRPVFTERYGKPTLLLGDQGDENKIGASYNAEEIYMKFSFQFNILDSKPVTTSLRTSTKLTLHSGDPLSNPTQYRQLVGGLQSFHTARYFLCSKLPMTIHASTNYRALDCRKTSSQVPFKNSYSWDPHASEKSIDITCVLGCRFGLVLLNKFEDNSFLGNNESKEISRSSTEAEYRSVANTAAELRWVCSLLTGLGIQLQQAPVIYCDNVGETYMCANPVFHTRMKHIALDYHYILETIQSGALRVTHILTRDQLADALTKPFSRIPFHTDCN